MISVLFIFTIFGFWLLVRCIFTKIIRHMLFQPSGIVGKYHEESYDDIYLENRINMRLFRRKQNNKVLLFCHGSGGNLSGRKNFIELTQKIGVDLCIFDYRGYGKSIPYFEPTQESITEDGIYMYDYLTRSYSKDNIVLCGSSMGSYVATYVAKEKNCKKLILFDVLSSIDDVAANAVKNNIIFVCLIKILLFILYFSNIELLRTNKIIKKLDCEILMIHGEKDNLTSAEHVKKMANKCSNISLIILPNANHYTIFHYTDLFIKKLEIIIF